MSFTTPDLGKYISGAILYEETLYQNHVDGDSMVEKLTKQGIIPGIKVDKGLKPLVGALEHETFCSGLDGLTERASDYYEQGARFAKWRAVLQITEDGPSDLAIQENAWGLARSSNAMGPALPSTPHHALRHECCNARPNENDKFHGTFEQVIAKCCISFK